MWNINDKEIAVEIIQLYKLKVSSIIKFKSGNWNAEFEPYGSYHKINRIAELRMLYYWVRLSLRIYLIL